MICYGFVHRRSTNDAVFHFTSRHPSENPGELSDVKLT